MSSSHLTVVIVILERPASASWRMAGSIGDPVVSLLILDSPRLRQLAEAGENDKTYDPAVITNSYTQIFLKLFKLFTTQRNSLYSHFFAIKFKVYLYRAFAMG